MQVTTQPGSHPELGLCVPQMQILPPHPFPIQGQSLSHSVWPSGLSWTLVFPFWEPVLLATIPRKASCENKLISGPNILTHTCALYFENTSFMLPGLCVGLITKNAVGSVHAGLRVSVVSSGHGPCLLRPLDNYSQQLEHPDPFPAPNSFVPIY